MKKSILPKATPLFLLAAVIFCACGFAVSPVVAKDEAPPLLIDHELKKRSVTPHLSYMVDPIGEATIADVMRQTGRFEPLTDYRGDPSFGYSRDAYWFMFRVKNTEIDPVAWILEFSYPLIDYIDLYVPEDGTYRVMETGDRLPFDQREMPVRTFAFPLTTKPGEQTFFLRVASSGSLTVPLTGWSPPVFQQKTNIETLIFGLIYGTLFAMAFYHLFIFFSIREKSYIYLTFFILAAGLFMMTHNGLSYQYFWPDSPALAHRVYPLLLALANLAALQFARGFLNTRNRFPRGEGMLLAAMAVAALLVPLSMVMDYFHTVRATTLLTAISSILLISAGIVSLVRGHREARYYLLACIAFFLGAMLTAVRAYGLLPENIITAWSSQVGLMAMALLFSFGVADKITVMRREREKAVKDLAESEEKYRTVVENAHDGILMIVEERPVFANATMLKMLNYEPVAFSLLKLENLLPDTPLGRELVTDRHRRRMRGEDVPTRYEGQMVKKDGTIIDCVFSSSYITIEGRAGVIAIISDITSLKAAEQRLADQYEEIRAQYEELERLNQELSEAQDTQIKLNERLVEEKAQIQAILKSIGDAVIATDHQNRVILMNNAAERITGKCQEDAIGREITELLGLSKEALPESFDGITGRPLTLKSEDGTECAVEIAGAPLRAPEKGKGGMVYAVRDITEKLKLEQEIQKAGKIESIGLLAGGIAHDFNNLLTAIIGSLSMLKAMSDENDRKFADALERIEHAAKQAVNLTRQLLTFSRGGDPVKKPASMRDLLHGNIAFLLSGSAVRPRFDLPEDLWPAEVDTDQIIQVIHNLVINAVQAMPNGGELVVSGANFDRVPWLPLPERRFVRISFLDKGPGIPHEYLDRVFDPYFSTKAKGSGLGLSICYSIVKKHGGHIDLDSTEGAGSAFHIYLPASSGEVTKKQSEKAEPKPRHGKILVMDDDPQVRDVAEGILTHLGFEVDCVDDGGAAINAYRRAREAGAPFSAVIMDLTIPGGTGGREAIRHLMEYDPDAVVLVSSGYSEDPVMSHYKDYGFSGVLTKPYTIEKLASVLDEAIHSS